MCPRLPLRSQGTGSGAETGDFTVGWGLFLVDSELLSKRNFSSGNTMPKLKTHSGAAKRFTKTASGKFKRGQSKMRHILTSKATKTKRHLGGAALISKADTPKIARMLPYA